MTSLYVGNLAYSLKWGQLKELFAAEVGEVEFADIPRLPDGKSRGYGIIRMKNEEDVQKAIDKLNGYEYEGRQLTVRLDSRPSKKGNQLFVGNLPWSTRWQELKDLAKEHGLNPVRADVTLGRDGRSRGWGLLAFETPEEAAEAIEKLNGLDYKERVLEVKEDSK